LPVCWVRKLSARFSTLPPKSNWRRSLSLGGDLSAGKPLFRRYVRPVSPYWHAITETMKTIAVIFVLALITIAGGIYSDAVLTSGQVRSVAVPDPATAAVARAARSSASSPFKGG
jgi:hypothetical protein